MGLWYYESFIIQQRSIAEKCQNLKPNWSTFVDCYGAISINDGWDINYLSIQDHIHNYEIARIYNKGQYIFMNKYIFVINQKLIENSSSNNNKITYHQKLFQGGRLIEKSYNSISDIPNYLVIDTLSGEVKKYINISDIPKNQQAYFEEISAKNENT